MALARGRWPRDSAKRARAAARCWWNAGRANRGRPGLRLVPMHSLLPPPGSLRGPRLSSALPPWPIQPPDRRPPFLSWLAHPRQHQHRPAPVRLSAFSVDLFTASIAPAAAPGFHDRRIDRRTNACTLAARPPRYPRPSTVLIVPSDSRYAATNGCTHRVRCRCEVSHPRRFVRFIRSVCTIQKNRELQ